MTSDSGVSIKVVKFETIPVLQIRKCFEQRLHLGVREIEGPEETCKGELAIDGNHSFRTVVYGDDLSAQ